MPAPNGLVVADDLSGASDTGHQFADRGYRTTVVTGDAGDPGDGSIVVVNTDSRYARPDAAADRVADAVDRYRTDFVYKKVDSTLRGNLLAETAAAVDATDAALAVVAPAFPATGRITVGGIHVVDGTPVARTDAGRDPDKPVPTSHVPTLFDGGPLDVEHVPIETVASGRSAVVDRFRSVAEAGSPTAVVCDATLDAHLEAIAGAAAAVDATVTYVGSGGLARHARVHAGAASGVLGVAGSASPRTFEQLAELDDDVVVVVDGARAVRDPSAAVERAADRVAAVLADGDRAVVTAARSAAEVEATIDAGEDEGLSGVETRERVADVLAGCTRAVATRQGVRGLFVTGGAVATRVLDELGATGIELTGRAVTDGVPIGRAIGGTLDGRPLVTKAGAFGEADVIFKALSALSRYDD